MITKSAILGMAPTPDLLSTLEEQRSHKVLLELLKGGATLSLQETLSLEQRIPDTQAELHSSKILRNMFPQCSNNVQDTSLWIWKHGLT